MACRTKWRSLKWNASLLVHTFKNEVQRSQQRTAEANKQVIENVTEYLNGLILSEMQLGTTVGQSTWVIKLSADTDVFEEQFDYQKRADIMAGICTSCVSIRRKPAAFDFMRSFRSSSVRSLALARATSFLSKGSRHIIGRARLK